MATRRRKNDDLPEAWLKPCLVAGFDERVPMPRGTIGRLRRALAIASTAEHDGLPDQEGVNRSYLRTAKPSTGPTRKLRTPCKHLVSIGRTDYGEREMTIETGDLDIEPIRFRIWMPDADQPIDPDFTDAATCMRNLRSHVRLLQAHLPAIAAAALRTPKPTTVADIDVVRDHARRVAAVASTWTDRMIMVETDTPWSRMRIHHLGERGAYSGEFIGDDAQMTAWATRPCLSARIEGGRRKPLIVSITALRVEARKATALEAMRAASMLPQTTDVAA